MGALKPLRDNASLDKLAYERIKDAILSFDFMPNQVLVEGELASQLKISKTPVRDALMRLEKEGLVIRIPFKGTYVSDISNQDMADTYEIRIALEGLAIRLATEFITEDDLQHLEKLMERHTEALEQRNVPKAMQINGEFHGTIINRCKNQRLVENLILLDDHLKRYRLLSIAQGLRLEKSVPEHRHIYEALNERNAQKAEAAMKEHLKSAMQDLYQQDFSELEKLVAKFAG